MSQHMGPTEASMLFDNMYSLKDLIEDNQGDTNEPNIFQNSFYYEIPGCKEILSNKQKNVPYLV